MLRWLGVGAGVLVLFVVLNVAKSIYVDLLWFDSVGYEGVYRKAIFARVLLFLVGAAVSAAVIGGNIWLARRLSPEAPEESFIEDVDPQAIRRIGMVLMVASTIFMALIFGSALGGQWQTLLSWLNSVSFGETDPQFGRDISFYLFDLPAYHHLQSWLLALLIVSTISAGAVYALNFSLQRFVLNVTRPDADAPVDPRRAGADRDRRRHLAECVRPRQRSPAGSWTARRTRMSTRGCRCAIC